MDDLTPQEFEKAACEAIDTGRETVLMFKDVDGNWRGLLRKDEHFAQVRDIGPETVLQLLLTHSGK